MLRNEGGTKKLLSFFGHCFYSYDLEKYPWKLMEKMFGAEATKYLTQTYSNEYYKGYIPQSDEEKEIDKWFNF